MTDKAGFFAGLADILTALCVYYFVAALLVAARGSWGVHLLWPLLWAVLCSFVFAGVLKRPRSAALLAGLTAALLAGSMGLFYLVSVTPMTFRYGLLLAVGGGMAVGMPLYFALHRPTIAKHLMYLDVLILTLAALLLVREALAIDGGTVTLMTLVLLLDAAGAVGLRMSDGDGHDGANALKGSLVALGAAAVLALVIWGCTAVFSRSGAVTGSILGGIGSVFAALGGALERLFLWLTRFVKPADSTAPPVEMAELPSVAAVEQEAAAASLPVNTTALGVILAVIALAGTALILVLLRKRRFARGTNAAPASSHTTVKRTGGTAGELWRRLMRALRFRWRAFLRRDTPGGLLIRLERLGRRRHTPREPGETMRHFIRRMDGSGGLDELSDALDREYYGGGTGGLAPGRCRRLRKYMRKAVRHG